jgi:hypothetical protein
MPRYPRVRCAGLCGRLIWAGTGSLPEGQAMCRRCRRLRREAEMPAADAAALARLVPYVKDAIGKQESHVADQLIAALRDGRTSLRFEPSAVGAVVVVVVDGYELCEVDVRNLVIHRTQKP